MALRGKRNQPAGTPPAKGTAGAIPRHGGPQTGNGHTAQGRKPQASEIVNRGNVDGQKSRLRIPRWLGGKG
jgi:hypothetical protein